MIKIRSATREDLKEIAKLNHMLIRYEIRYDKLLKTRNLQKELLRYNLKHLRSKRSKIFVAEENKKIVGYVMGFIQKKPKILKIKEAGYLCEAFVLPKYRKKGIMKKLSKEFFKWLKSKNMKYVYLDVFTRNYLGVRAWRKMGFKELLFNMRKKL